MQLTNYPTAPLSRRLLAMAYDGLVLVAMYILFGGVLVTVVSKALGYEEFVRLTPAQAASLFYVICFLYYSHSWRKGGQTIGMKAWRIYLTTLDGSHIRLSHCMLRSATGLFSLMLFGAGYLWMLIDKQQRTWHDMASLTRVAYRPKGID